MDLQEKLNEVQGEIEMITLTMAESKERLKDLKKKEKGYLKLIEWEVVLGCVFRGAKSLEQK